MLWSIEISDNMFEFSECFYLEFMVSRVDREKIGNLYDWPLLRIMKYKILPEPMKKKNTKTDDSKYKNLR